VKKTNGALIKLQDQEIDKKILWSGGKPLFLTCSIFRFKCY